MQELKEQDISPLVFEAKGTVVVDFYGDWCKPCKVLEPQLEKLAEKREDVTFYKADVGKLLDFSQFVGALSLPTVAVFKDGKRTHRVTGFGPSTVAEIESYL